MRTRSEEEASQILTEVSVCELFMHSSQVDINHFDKPGAMCQEYLQPSPSTVGKCQQK